MEGGRGREGEGDEEEEKDDQSTALVAAYLALWEKVEFPTGWLGFASPVPCSLVLGSPVSEAEVSSCFVPTGPKYGPWGAPD